MSKNKISLNHIQHNNAMRMAAFLNMLDDEMKEITKTGKKSKMQIS